MNERRFIHAVNSRTLFIFDVFSENSKFSEYTDYILLSYSAFSGKRSGKPGTQGRMIIHRGVLSISAGL